MDWASFLKRYNLKHSKSRRGTKNHHGNCRDNAVAESFFNLLKRERIWRRAYKTGNEARKDVFDYTEMFYNPKRKHTRNRMPSPVDFEMRQNAKDEDAKKTRSYSRGTNLKINEMKVWDPYVRLFHWVLVISFVQTYFTEFDFLNLHVWFGYIISVLLIFRIVWGLFGSPFARFSNFLKPPTEIWNYLRTILRGTAERFIGHNPVGGAMVLALLIFLSLTCVSGMLLYGAEGGAGPFAFVFGDDYQASHLDDWLEEAHAFTANITAILVVFHIAGVFLACIHHRENLIKSMFTGKKRF